MYEWGWRPDPKIAAAKIAMRSVNRALSDLQIVPSGKEDFD